MTRFTWFASLFRSHATPVDPGKVHDSLELEEALRFEPSLLNSRGEWVDVAQEARWALTELAGRAARTYTQLEMAVSPGLTVRMDPRALRKLLIETVLNAIAAAPGGRVLLTGSPHGGRVQIGVSHDGPAVMRDQVETELRLVSQIAALNGGTLEVTVRAGQGATVLVRLPQPARPAQAPPPVPQRNGSLPAPRQLSQTIPI